MRPVCRIRLENAWQEDLGHNRKQFIQDTERPDIGPLRILIPQNPVCRRVHPAAVQPHLILSCFFLIYWTKRFRAEIKYRGMLRISSPFVSLFIEVFTEYFGRYFFRYSARERALTLCSDLTSIGTISAAH